MIEIDGSLGEGGGQILRTAVAMSAVTGRAVRIKNIRAKRDNPGLAAQHYAAVKAVAELCDAGVEGLCVGSKEIVFSPGEIKSGRINIDVGTAGSVTLVLQALLIPAFCSREGVRIKITGGTDVRWSPSADYMRYVVLPLLQKHGFSAGIVSLERGYYPRGGGRMVVDVKPSLPEKEINLPERGRLISIRGVSHASRDIADRMVAQRQAKAARALLFNRLANMGYTGCIDLETEYNAAASTGSGITLWAQTDHSIIGADALGEKSKKAEEVGESAARGLIAGLESCAAVDSHMADQIIPYLALSGGVVKVGGLTEHARTNIIVVNVFGFRVTLDGDMIMAEKPSGSHKP